MNDGQITTSLPTITTNNNKKKGKRNNVIIVPWNAASLFDLYHFHGHSRVCSFSHQLTHNHVVGMQSSNSKHYTYMCVSVLCEHSLMGSVGGWLEPFLPDYFACIVYVNIRYTQHQHFIDCSCLFYCCANFPFLWFDFFFFSPNCCDFHLSHEFFLTFTIFGQMHSHTRP